METPRRMRMRDGVVGSQRRPHGASAPALGGALITRQRGRGHPPSPYFLLLLLAGLSCTAPRAAGDPIFGARVSHMTVPNGADDPKLSVAFWPHEEGVPLPELAPGQESMVLRDGSTGRDHLCIIPNITATGLPGDEEEEEEELSQSATGGGAGAHTGDPQRGTEGEGEDEEDEEDEEGEAGAKGRMRRWRGRLRRKPPQRGQHHQRPLGQHGSGDLGLGQGQEGGVAEGDTRRSPEELLSALKGLPCSYKMEGWWTYEFCYKDKVRQLHFEPVGENKLVITMEFVLGLYDEAATLEAQRQHEAALVAMPPADRRGKNRYHVQVYTGGTACDLTGTPRKTQVRFFCDDSAAEGQRGQQQQQQQPANTNMIKSLKEAPTCEYEMHYVSSLLCQHRDFQTVAPAMNVINCYELPPPENQGSQGGPSAPAATPQEGEGQGSPGGVQGEPAVERGEGREGGEAPPLGNGREGGEASEGGKTEEVEMQEDVEMVTLEEEVAQL